jgi:hypothetical protein
VSRAYPIDVEVATGAVVVGREGPRVLPLRVHTSCLGLIAFCVPIDIGDLQRAVAQKLAPYRILEAAAFDRLALGLTNLLTEPSLFASPDEWKGALEGTLSYDEIRDGLRRALALGRRGAHPWCDAMAASTQESLYLVATVRVSREELDDWTRHCDEALLATADEARKALRPIEVLEASAARGQWLDVEESGLIPAAGKGAWLADRTLRLPTSVGTLAVDKRSRGFSARVVPVAADVAAEPIDLRIDTGGGRSFVEVSGYFGGIGWSASGGEEKDHEMDAVVGLHVAVPLVEVATPFVELETGRSSDRIRAGLGFSPWCLWRGARTAVCRNPAFELEYAASFDDGEYVASMGGFRVSLWNRRWPALQRGTTIGFRFGPHEQSYTLGFALGLL